MKSFRSLTPDTFRGKALAIVQSTEEQGTIQLAVSAKDLPDAVISIETIKCGTK
jgi:beta-galactosidase